MARRSLSSTLRKREYCCFRAYHAVGYYSTQFCTNLSSLKGEAVGELHKNVQEDGELRISIIHVFGESCYLS